MLTHSLLKQTRILPNQEPDIIKERWRPRVPPFLFSYDKKFPINAYNPKRLYFTLRHKNLHTIRRFKMFKNLDKLTLI